MKFMKKTVFTGAATAIITPFKDNKIDFESFAKLIDWQIAEGVNAIVAAGTTGEGSTLSDEEHRDVVKYTVDRVAGRVPVIAGTGSNDTAYAIELTKYACQVGADAMLLVTPYYNKATQKGLVKMFTEIADKSTAPVILYNVPSRTGVNLGYTLLRRLAQKPNIVGIKEASGDVGHAARIIAACGDDLPLYSGCDNLTLPLLSLGAAGVISVVGNIIPAIMHAICHTYFAGQHEKAARAHLGVLALMDASMAQVNPVPIKTALAMMGVCREEFRLPLCPMLPGEKRALAELLREYGLTEP